MVQVSIYVCMQFGSLVRYALVLHGFRSLFLSTAMCQLCMAFFMCLVRDFVISFFSWFARGAFFYFFMYVVRSFAPSLCMYVFRYSIRSRSFVRYFIVIALFVSFIWCSFFIYGFLQLSMFVVRVSLFVYIYIYMLVFVISVWLCQLVMSLFRCFVRSFVRHAVPSFVIDGLFSYFFISLLCTSLFLCRVVYLCGYLCTSSCRYVCRYFVSSVCSYVFRWFVM